MISALSVFALGASLAGAGEARIHSARRQVAPGVVQYTTDVLFRDLRLRPALAPRDRSLVTSALPVVKGVLEKQP